MLDSFAFALNMLARLVKHVGYNFKSLFSIIFGATFVFKISPNFTFKNILEKWDF
jgi:hypothetical protein